MLTKAVEVERRAVDTSKRVLAGAAAGVKVLNAALEERDDKLILRGTISPESLRLLRKDTYQREVLAESGGRRSSRLRKGIEEGSVLPDIELGMRGQNFSTRGNTVTLHDPVYIIDGLQRVSAMMAHMEDTVDGDAAPLGATIHFSTTAEWEKERFAILNQLRTPVSPNVLLRNSKESNPSILTLFGLSTNEPGFPLYERVCWNQRMAKKELITASALVRAAMSMHRHFSGEVTTGSGGHSGEFNTGDGAIRHKPAMLDRYAKHVGLNNFRNNVRGLFDLIDECWGIRTIEYGEAQGHLRGNFLMTLGAFLSRNPQLWAEGQKTLNIDSKTKLRLKAFKVNDPEIRRLSSAGTMALPILYEYLLQHMNKGKSKHKFK